MDENQEGIQEPNTPLTISPGYNSGSFKYFDYPSSKPFINTDYTLSDRVVNTQPTSDRDAVITALKNLQDKIKQLEIERTAAEKNLQSLTSETEQHIKVLKDGKPAGSSWARQDKQVDKHGDFVMTQTRELEGQLSSAERRCHLLEKQLHEMRKLVENSERNQRDLMEQMGKTHQERDVTGAEVRQHMDRLNELERDQMRLAVTQTVAEKLENAGTESKIKELEKNIKEENLHRKTLQEKTSQLESATHSKKILSSHHTPSSSAPAAVKTFQTQVLKTKKPSKKKKKTVHSGGPASTCRPEPMRHYRLNLAEIPFVAGKSTGPSHSLGANVQKVLAMMKLHNTALCSQANANGDCPRPESSSSTGSSVTSADQDLSDLLTQLQDEFGQLSSKHQEIVEQMHMARDIRLKDKLEQELDMLVDSMESKSQQISKIRQHQRKTEDARRVRSSSAKRSEQSKRPHTATNKHHSHQHHSNNINRNRPKSHSCNKPVGNSALGKPALFMLRDMKKLQSTLRKDDLCWE